MLCEWPCEIIIMVLLAVICFLLYKIYTIKYTGGRGTTEFVPKNLEKDLENLGDDGSREMEMRFGDINSRISELEKKLEKNETVIERLIEELG